MHTPRYQRLGYWLQDHGLLIACYLAVWSVAVGIVHSVVPSMTVWNVVTVVFICFVASFICAVIEGLLSDPWD